MEWSTFEHVPDAIGALSRVPGGLVPGGMFVTTTFCKDWTPEEIEHYRRDSFEAEIAEQYLSGEADAWLRERFFDVLSPENTIAKVLIKGVDSRATEQRRADLHCAADVRRLIPPSCGGRLVHVGFRPAPFPARARSRRP